MPDDPPSGQVLAVQDSAPGAVVQSIQKVSALQAMELVTMPRHDLATNDNANRRSTHGDDILPASTGTGTQTSPINRLPTELLQEVLLESIDAYGPSPSPPFPPDTPSRCPLTGSHRIITTRAGAWTSPVLLGQVCSTWRKTVRATPALWATIDVNHPEMRDFPLFEFWLERSGAHPIDLALIQLGGNDEDFEAEAATVGLFVKTAFLHSSHLRSVTFYLGSDIERVFLSTLAGIDQHFIREFLLQLNGWSSIGIERISDFLCKSPHLERGGWGQCVHPSRLTDFPQELWSRLSSLHFDILGVRDIRHLFPKIKSVKSLSVETLFGVDSDYWISDPTLEPALPERVELGELTMLTVSWYEEMAPIFDSLILPALTSISLGAQLTKDDERAKVDERALQALVKRSGCKPRRIMETNLPRLVSY